MKLTTEELREMRERCEVLGAVTLEETWVHFKLKAANVLPEDNWGIKWMHSHSSNPQTHETLKQEQRIEWDMAHAIVGNLNATPRLLDAYEALERENERLRKALEKATSWASELVEAYQQCDCTDPDGGNPMTCEYCSGMRTIESLQGTLKGGTRDAVDSE